MQRALDIIGGRFLSKEGAEDLPPRFSPQDRVHNCCRGLMRMPDCAAVHILVRGDEMCPNSLIATITALAAAIAEGRDADEISVIAASLTQLGDTLATIAAQKAFCESSKGA
jgi:hypothetical protein